MQATLTAEDKMGISLSMQEFAVSRFAPSPPDPDNDALYRCIAIFVAGMLMAFVYAALTTPQ